MLPTLPTQGMQRISSIALAIAMLGTTACGESREERMRRQMGYDSSGPKDGDEVEIPQIPAHPTRDALAPVLGELYAADSLPDVQDTTVTIEGQNFEVTNPGALAVVNIRPGVSKTDQVQAIIRGVAEADAFAVRSGGDKYFSEQLTKIKYSFDDAERDLIRTIYGDLRLLDFFASEAGDTAIAKLEGEVQTATKALQEDYLGRKDEIWDRWMGVKMYARRVVSYDLPFKPVLRSLRKRYEMKEPVPITWEEAHGPAFTQWAKTINGDDQLFKMLTNLPELREQEEFRGDTHARWAVAGSAVIPAEAKGTKIEKDVGYGVYREDLGSGFQEITFIFDAKLKGAALKEAYLRSLIYRQVFSDFATLSTAGGDFEGDQVPDENDADYAYCASRMALDAMINDYGDDKAILSGLKSTQSNEDKLISDAIDCLLLRIPKGINRGTPDDEARPPAPASRNAFFQMIARFTKVSVDLDNMKKDVKKSAEVEDAEAFLKEFDDERKKEMR